VEPSDIATKEILAADAVVIGVPMWNFSIPATLKNWVDLTLRSGVTFKAGDNGYEPLLAPGKKAYLVVATGGVELGSDYDMATPYMKVALNFIGISDIEVIAADNLMTPEGDARLKAAHDAVLAL